MSKRWHDFGYCVRTKLGTFLAVALTISSTTLLAEVESQVDSSVSTQVLRGFGVVTHFDRSDKGWDVTELMPFTERLGVQVVREGILWERTEKKKVSMQ